MFDVVQSSWTSTTYLPTWQMDMDWMQPGNNSNIHPTRRRFYIPLRKSDRKKEKNGKKNEVRKRKAPIHNRFIDMGWYIIHGSVGQNILIQTPSFSSKRRKLLRACRASETTCERREFAGSNATAATTNGGHGGGGGEGEQGIGDESDGRRA